MENSKGSNMKVKRHNSVVLRIGEWEMLSRVAIILKIYK